MSTVLSMALLIGLPSLAWAAPGLQDVPMTHEVTRLFLQLGIIILAAKTGGSLARALHLPALIGELAMGFALGPYALGSIPLPYFQDGLVPLVEGAFPVSLQLYGFAAVGAVIHILVVGLETDIDLFSRTRQRGFGIALGSSLTSLIIGLALPMLILRLPLWDRSVLFFASLSVSTSLGVQARILHAQHKMATPEGAAIVSGSLMQDGFAIIFLALAMAIGNLDARTEATDKLFLAALPVTVMATAMLIGGGIVAYLAAPRVAVFFQKRLRPTNYSVLVVAIALTLSGVFEAFGVAAIIGAYIIGISFSRTDIGDVLSEKSQPLSELFVPVLYVVMGMLVDFKMLINPRILVTGFGFALLSACAKIIGGGVPALTSGFTRWGALRVGLGTVPRGEVALIIASVGLALGDFPQEFFKVMVVMIMFSVVLGAPALALAFKYGKAGTVGNWGNAKPDITAVKFPNEELSDLVFVGLVRVAEEDGFFIHRLEQADVAYRLRKGERFLTVRRSPNNIEILSAPEDTGIARTLLYEVIIHVKDRVSRITELAVPSELRRDVAAGSGRETLDLSGYLNVDCAAVPLKSSDKVGAIGELVELLSRNGLVTDSAGVVSDVLEREASLSTGMEKGLAIPHARTAGVAGIAVAVGIAPEGIDFQSLDGLPARIIFLIASAPENRGPHLQLLAAIVKRMRVDETRELALGAKNPEDLIAAILGNR